VNLSLPIAYRDDIFTLYLNSNYLPRAFMVYDYEVIRDSNKVLSRMKERKEDFNKMVFLESEPMGMPKSNGYVKNSVDILKYSAQHIDIKVFSEKKGIMILSDSYYPGWEASIDGQPVKIYPADYAFRAIAIPAGEHMVTFRFNPFSFNTGFAITLIFLLGAFLLCLKPVKV
jgi:uncharacterized membrane protein YfhO